VQRRNLLKIIKMRVRKLKKGEFPMMDIILKYMNSNVVVKTVESSYFGKLVKCEENWIVIFEGEKKGEASINLDYVTSIKPYQGKIK
jgi:hypothetical protein